jgi:acyl-CoA synthetase (NDP forming)
LVSQSGALAGGLLDYAYASGYAFSYVVSTGNEAMIGIADVIDFLVDDPATKAIAVFAEVIRHPDRFRSAVERAAAAEKAVVMLKVGSSEISARTAAAHTGALVGDDRVIGAVLRQHGVMRVASMEELINTAALAAHTGRMRRPGIAVASISGGGCDIVADRAAEVGLPLPELAPSTVAELGGLVAAYGHAQNPLDVTGAVLTNPPLFGQLVGALTRDPGVGAVLALTEQPTLPDHPSTPPQVNQGIAEAFATSPIPGVFANQTDRAVTSYTREVWSQTGIRFGLPGLHQAVLAFGHVSRWSQLLASRSERPAAAPAPRPVIDVEPGTGLNEAEVRALLAAAGVAEDDAVLVRTADEAAAAAERVGGPLAMKVVSPDLLHKTDIGGVRLHVRGPAEAREAFAAVTSAAAVLDPAPRIDGALVAPMREGGVEILVGIVRDPEWGLTLAVGLGGVLVEVLDDVAVAVLPVTASDVEQLLGTLRGRKVLDGVRGRAAVDVPALARAITRIAEVAAALGDRLESLEVNPLWAEGDRVAVLDAVLTWASG